MSIISGRNQIDTHIAEGKFNESKSLIGASNGFSFLSDDLVVA